MTVPRRPREDDPTPEALPETEESDQDEAEIRRPREDDPGASKVSDIE